MKNKLAEWDAPMSQIVSLTATSALSSLIFMSQFWRNIFVKTLSSTTSNRQHGIVVMGISDAFVYAHNNHRHNTDNPRKYEDCMEGWIRRPDGYHAVIRQCVLCLTGRSADNPFQST